MREGRVVAVKGDGEHGDLLAVEHRSHPKLASAVRNDGQEQQLKSQVGIGTLGIGWEKVFELRVKLRGRLRIQRINYASEICAVGEKRGPERSNKLLSFFVFYNTRPQCCGWKIPKDCLAAMDYQRICCWEGVVSVCGRERFPNRKISQSAQNGCSHDSNTSAILKTYGSQDLCH